MQIVLSRIRPYDRSAPRPTTKGAIINSHEGSAAGSPEALAEIRGLVELNTGLTRQVLELTDRVRVLTEEIHRLTTNLTATVGQAASKAMLVTWENEVVTVLGVRVEERFSSGVHGALGVRSEAGVPLVLKVLPIEREREVRRSVELAGRLRSRGVPVPDPYLVGRAAQHVYTLQQRCAGGIARPLQPSHARAMLDAWELHAGAGSDLDPSTTANGWPEAVQRALTVGEPSMWVQHNPIRAAGATAAGLLDEIVKVGRALDTRALARSDAVHMDWHHRNVLVDGDQVSAIIDWEMARPGDARFDLVVLAFWSEVYRGREVDEEAADEIRGFTSARVDPTVRAGLAALQAVMQLSSTASNRPDLLPKVTDDVERFLAPWWRAPTRGT